MSRYPNDMYLDDDFPIRRPRQQGDEHTPLSEWGMLAKGKTLGKTIDMAFDRTLPALSSNPVNMFEVSGADEFAMNLNVHVSPPKKLPGTGIPTGYSNNTLKGGTQLNTEEPLTLIGSGVWANPVVDLEWGIGGIANKATIDVLNGLAVNISASWVRVGGRIETPLGLPGLTVYQLGCFVGPGFAKARSAQRTVIVNALTAANVDQGPFAIPTWAKTVYVTSANGAAVPAVYTGFIRFLRSAALATDTVADYFYSSNVQTPFPIPNGAYFFSIVPADANLSVQVVFDLAI